VRWPQWMDLGRNAVLAIALALATECLAAPPVLVAPPSSDPAAIDEMKRLVLSSRGVGVRHTATRKQRARFRTKRPCSLRTQVGEYSVDLPIQSVGPLSAALQIDHLSSVDDSLRVPCLGDTIRSDEISMTFVQGVDTVRVNLAIPPWYCYWLRNGQMLGFSELGSRSAEVLKVLAEALPGDWLLTAVAPCDTELAARSNAQPGRAPGFGGYVYVEELPEATKRVPPAYPTGARFSGISGTVMVQALINTKGDVAATVIVRSIPELDAAAAKAVEQWHFKPARARGVPTSVWVAVPVKFNLR
jgi:TonB family protein